MGVKKNKQKNTRHHVVSAPSIAKKKSTKAKLRNQTLRAKLDEATGLAGAINLFTSSTRSKESEKMAETKRIEEEKAMEDDLVMLMSMKLSSTGTK
jgi:hypothetical protein